MSLTGVIERFARRDYTFARPSGSYVKGRWVETAGATFTARAVVQPASGDDVQRLPEGKRTVGARAVWCATELRLGDRLDAEGVSWEIGHVEFWEEGGFYKAVATRR